MLAISYLVLQAFISFCSLSDKSGTFLFVPCLHQNAGHMTITLAGPLNRCIIWRSLTKSFHATRHFRVYQEWCSAPRQQCKGGKSGAVQHRGEG